MTKLNKLDSKSRIIIALFAVALAAILIPLGFSAFADEGGENTTTVPVSNANLKILPIENGKVTMNGVELVPGEYISNIQSISYKVNDDGTGNVTITFLDGSESQLDCTPISSDYTFASVNPSGEESSSWGENIQFIFAKKAAPVTGNTLTVSSNDPAHTNFYYDVYKGASTTPIESKQETKLDIKFPSEALAKIDEYGDLVVTYSKDGNDYRYDIFANAFFNGKICDSWALDGTPITDPTIINKSATVSPHYSDLQVVDLTGTGTEGHKDFHYEGFYNDKPFGANDKEKIEDFAIIGAKATATEDGLLTLSYTGDKDNNVKNIITANAKEGYKFDHFTINGKDFKPGDEYTVTKDENVQLEAHYVNVNKASETPQTGDSAPYALVGFAAIALVAASVLVVNRKKLFNK